MELGVLHHLAWRLRRRMNESVIQNALSFGPLVEESGARTGDMPDGHGTFFILGRPVGWQVIEIRCWVAARREHRRSVVCPATSTLRQGRWCPVARRGHVIIATGERAPFAAHRESLPIGREYRPWPPSAPFGPDLT